MKFIPWTAAGRLYRDRFLVCVKLSKNAQRVADFVQNFKFFEILVIIRNIKSKASDSGNTTVFGPWFGHFFNES